MDIQRKQAHLSVHDVVDDYFLGLIYDAPPKRSKLRRRLEECVEEYFDADAVVKLVTDLPDNYMNVDFRSKELTFEIEQGDDDLDEYTFELRKAYVY